MLVIAVFAVLIPSAMPKGWLPVGCVARYGNPVAKPDDQTPTGLLRADNESADFWLDDTIHIWNWATGVVRKSVVPAKEREKREREFQPLPPIRFEVRKAKVGWELRDLEKKTTERIRFSNEGVEVAYDGLLPIPAPTDLIAVNGTITPKGFAPKSGFFVINPKTGACVAEYVPPKGRGATHVPWFHPNGREVWVSQAPFEHPQGPGLPQYVEGRLIVLDLATGTVKRAATFPSCVGFTLSDRNGRFVALSYRQEDDDANFLCRALDTHTGREVLTHAPGVGQALSPNGRWLFTSERKVFDLSRPEREPFRLPVSFRDDDGLRTQAWKVAFSPDGKRMVTGHETGCVYV